MFEHLAPSFIRCSLCSARRASFAWLALFPQTTYDIVIRDCAMLKRFDWSAVVIDEGHSLKGGFGVGGVAGWLAIE